jgi:hypothetical protein
MRALLLLLLLLFTGQPLPADACEVHVAPCLSRFAWSSLRVQAYQAVLINTGWEARQQQQQQPFSQQQQQQQQPAFSQQQQQQHCRDAEAGHKPPAAAERTGVIASWEQYSGPELPGCSCTNGNSSSSRSMSSLPHSVQRLAMLPIPQLCPRGFVMIWANKEHLAGGLQGHKGSAHVCFGQHCSAAHHVNTVHDLS